VVATFLVTIGLSHAAIDVKRGAMRKHNTRHLFAINPARVSNRRVSMSVLGSAVRNASLALSRLTVFACHAAILNSELHAI
jgi:hypothetical protein